MRAEIFSAIKSELLAIFYFTCLYGQKKFKHNNRLFSSFVSSSYENVQIEKNMDIQ